MRLKLIDWERAVMAKTHYLSDRCIIPVALAGILLLGGQNALACGNGKLLFQDKFQTVDPRWGFAAIDPTRSVGADGLSYSSPGLQMYSVNQINQASLYDDYEVCAHITMKYSDEKSNAFAFVTFWADDSFNKYAFSSSSMDGTYSVSRTQKSKLLTQIPWGEPTPAINKGSGVVNELSVAVRGNHAVFSINNQKVDEFDGQAPDGGSKIGFGMQVPMGEGPVVFGVKDLEVRALQ